MLKNDALKWYRGHSNEPDELNEDEKTCPSCGGARHTGSVMCFLGHKGSAEVNLFVRLFCFKITGNTAINAEVNKRVNGAE